MTKHLVVSGVSKSFIINGSFFEKFIPFSSKKTKGFKHFTILAMILSMEKNMGLLD